MFSPQAEDWSSISNTKCIPIAIGMHFSLIQELLFEEAYRLVKRHFNLNIALAPIGHEAWTVKYDSASFSRVTAILYNQLAIYNNILEA